MNRTPHPIPYQGSKRGLAGDIVLSFPEGCERVVEPFCGSAAVTLAALNRGCVKKALLSDVNEPLMELWREIIERPDRIARAYERLWNAQLGDEREFYDKVRERFNSTKQPADLLYLLARCVKASIRYNSDGEFNQSPDNRRRGANPTTMRTHILGASSLLRGRTELRSGDYREILGRARQRDVVYMDPPYQGLHGSRDPRYLQSLSYDEFVRALSALNENGTAYLVSYDGSCGEKTYGRELPPELNLSRILLHAGRSTQATLLGRSAITYESLYISEAIVRRLAAGCKKAHKKNQFEVLTLFRGSL
jgi:DNA adenine methylase